MDARQRIKELIENSDTLSYTNVAKKAGLSNSALQKYCTGRVNSMTLENIEKVAKALDVSMRWILFGEDDTNVISIFDTIPANRRSQAIEILRTFAKSAKGGEAG